MKFFLTALIVLLTTSSLGSLQQELVVRVTCDGKKPYDLATSGFAHISFYNAVLGKLLSISDTQDIAPGLLKKAYWDFSKNRYILELRDGLRFHHRRLVNAEDLYFSLVRFFLTQKRSDPVIVLRNIRGIQDLRRGDTYIPWSVPGIQKISEQSIAIELVQPDPLFLYGLTEGWLSVVPREMLTDDYVTWKSVPVGAGDFQVERDAPGTAYVVLRRTSEKLDGFDKVVFTSNPLDTDVDIAGFASDNPCQEKLQEIVLKDPNGFIGIFFNFAHPLAQNKNFRAAISHAINRSKIVGAHAHYNHLNQMLTSNFVGRFECPEKYNLETARAYLARIIPSKEVAKPLIVYSHRKGKLLSAFEQRYLGILKNELQEIGLNISFQEADTLTFQQNDSAVFRLDERGTSFVDPLIPLRAYAAGGVLTPFYPINEPMLAEQLSQASYAKSIEEKAKFARQISRDFYDQDIVIPIFERKTVYWINPKKVLDIGAKKGMTLDVSTAIAIKTR